MSTPDRPRVSELRKRVLMSLKKGHGLSMPSAPEGEDGDVREFPKDLTQLTEIAVRQEMSYWKAMAGFVNTLLARSQVDEKAYKREVREYERSYKWNNKPDKNAPMWEVEAGLAEDEHYQRISLKLEAAEATVLVLKSLRDAYAGYYDVCSREMTARMGELSREHNGGSGVG